MRPRPQQTPRQIIRRRRRRRRPWIKVHQQRTRHIKRHTHTKRRHKQHHQQHRQRPLKLQHPPKHQHHRTRHITRGNGDLQPGLLDRKARQILLPALLNHDTHLPAPAREVLVEELPVHERGEHGAGAGGDVAEADLQVVEAVDVRELRGDDGGDVVEGGEEEGVVEEEERVLDIPEDVEGRERVGEAEFGRWEFFSGLDVLEFVDRGCGSRFAHGEVVDEAHVVAFGWDGAVAYLGACCFGEEDGEDDEEGGTNDREEPEYRAPAEEL